MGSYAHDFNEGRTLNHNPIGDWLNGEHPYLYNARNKINNGLNSARDWAEGDHPYLGAAALGIAIGVGIAATAVLAPEALPAWALL